MSDSGRRLDAHLVSPIVAGYDTREVGLADGLFRTGRWGLERDFQSPKGRQDPLTESLIRMRGSRLELLVVEHAAEPEGQSVLGE